MTEKKGNDPLSVITMTFKAALMNMLESADNGKMIIYPDLAHEVTPGVYVMHHLGDFQVGNYIFTCTGRTEDDSCYEYSVEKLDDTPFGKTTMINGHGPGDVMPTTEDSEAD